MTTEVLERNPRPPKIDVAAWVALSLEMGMFGTFIYEKSVLGLVLFAGYLYFSATWAVIKATIEGGEG